MPAASKTMSTSTGSVPPLQVTAALARLLDARGERLAIKELPGGRYLYVSPALLSLMTQCHAALAAPEVGAIGRTDADIFGGALAVQMSDADTAAAKAAAPTVALLTLPIDSGARHQRVERVVVDPDPSVAGDTRLLVALWTDAPARVIDGGALEQALARIEQQQHTIEALRRELAEVPHRDLVSGLRPRSHFDEQLRREVDLSQREHREFAIVFIALDGRADGDVALGPLFDALGRLLKGGTRAMDASCRWDESRFALLLSGVGLATAHSRMESLRRQCATEIVVYQGQELRFTVAMGVASFPHTADEAQQLLAAGQQALQQAQRRGGNQVSLASIRLDAA